MKKTAPMRKLLMIANGSVREVEVGQELTIGRAYTNLLRIDGEEVSRVHAILYKRDQDYLIRDLDSKNGVFVNGQRVTSSLVVPGDEIQIGNAILLFDPPADFDVAAFLKQRQLVPAEQGPQPAKQASSQKIRKLTRSDDTNERFETSIHFVPQGLPQVFWELSEIDELSHTDAFSPSGVFTTELLRALRTLTGSSSSDKHDDNDLAQRVLAAAISATHADRGVLVLREGSGDALRLEAIYPRDRDVSVTRVVLRATLREMRGVLCNDAQTDPRFNQTETVRRENISSLLGFPLVAEGRSVGLLYVDTQGRPNAFRREHLVIINFLARIYLLALAQAEAISER